MILPERLSRPSGLISAFAGNRRESKGRERKAFNVMTEDVITVRPGTTVQEMRVGLQKIFEPQLVVPDRFRSRQYLV